MRSAFSRILEISSSRLTPPLSIVWTLVSEVVTLVDSVAPSRPDLVSAIVLPARLMLHTVSAPAGRDAHHAMAWSSIQRSSAGRCEVLFFFLEPNQNLHDGTGPATWG